MQSSQNLFYQSATKDDRREKRPHGLKKEKTYLAHTKDRGAVMRNNRRPKFGFENANSQRNPHIEHSRTKMNGCFLHEKKILRKKP